MTAQRIVTNQVGNDHYSVVEEAIKIVVANRSLQRMIRVCDICGMRYLSITPTTCESCGATSLSLQSDNSPEISRRG